MNRLTDGEEVIREHLRSLRQSEAALNALEKENTELHDKVNLLIQEKGAITRELEKTKVGQLKIILAVCQGIIESLKDKYL